MMECPSVEFKGMELLGQQADNMQGQEEHNIGIFVDRNTTELETHEVLTSLGIHQRVYVRRSKRKTALITYHDIGTNHTSFLAFFNLPEMRVICNYFTVYHICAPGHHEGATKGSYDLPSEENTSQQIPLKQFLRSHSVQSENSFTDDSPSKTLTYPSLDQLARMITSILGHFEIESFVGIGMGAGSNVLARYALQNPNSVLGLFLINPNATTHAYIPWARLHYWDLPYLDQGVVTENILTELENHWFGVGLAENKDLCRFYESLFRSLNPSNVGGYIQSYIDRTPLGLVRRFGPTMANSKSGENKAPEVIQTDVFLVTGNRAIDIYDNLAEMNAQMDPKYTQYIAITDCTGMVMEENPVKLTLDFLHFLRSIGLVINLTPERLNNETMALCSGQHGLPSARPTTETDFNVTNEF